LFNLLSKIDGVGIKEVKILPHVTAGSVDVVKGTERLKKTTSEPALAKKGAKWKKAFRLTSSSLVKESSL
jgi:hypothetical protein